jgi:hypothetical protein
VLQTLLLIIASLERIALDISVEPSLSKSTYNDDSRRRLTQRHHHTILGAVLLG